MSTTKYIHAGQQRILRMLMTLAGHEAAGLSPTQIAELQECSPALVTRDLANLQHAGFAEQVPGATTWRLAPPVVQISVRLSIGLDKAQAQLDDVRNRFTRT